MFVNFPKAFTYLLSPTTNNPVRTCITMSTVQMRKLKLRGEITWLVRGCAETWTQVWVTCNSASFSLSYQCTSSFPLSLNLLLHPNVDSPCLLIGRRAYKQPSAWTSCRRHLAPVILIQVRYSIIQPPQSQGREKSFSSEPPALKNPYSWNAPPSSPSLREESKCGCGRDRKETQLLHSSQHQEFWRSEHQESISPTEENRKQLTVDILTHKKPVAYLEEC